MNTVLVMWTVNSLSLNISPVPISLNIYLMSPSVLIYLISPFPRWRCGGCGSLNDPLLKSCSVCSLPATDSEVWRCPGCGDYNGTPQVTCTSCPYARHWSFVDVFMKEQCMFLWRSSEYLLVGGWSEVQGLVPQLVVWFFGITGRGTEKGTHCFLCWGK